MEKESITISKDTRKLIDDISRYPKDKYDKVINFLETLDSQQSSEAELEKQRGWRHMWERTPKPFLLLMGYFVFLAPVGSVGYYSSSLLSENLEYFIPYYFIILFLIIIIPLLIVSHISYKYLNKI